MKVALISHEFPPFFFGGVGSYCYDLAYSLAKTGTSVTVFAGKSTKIRTERIHNLFDVIRLPYLDFPPRALWFQIMNFRSFSKLLEDYDIIHIVDVHSGTLPVYIGKKLKKPIVTSIHTVPQIYLLKTTVYFPIQDLSVGDIGLVLFEYPIRTFDTRFCLDNSTSVVFCGQYALDKMKAYLNLDAQKASVIYNGVRLDEIDKSLPYLSEKTVESPKIVFAGRLFYSKGTTYLIRALASLKKNLGRFDCEIFGEGPLKHKIEKQIMNFGLSGEVHMRGFLNNRAKLLEEIRGASLFVLPSLLEVGPPIAALEAMACSKPVVAFDTPFMREFIVNMENGVLARQGDVDDLAMKLYLLLADKKLCARLGQRAYEYVKENHNWSTLIRNYVDLYNVLSSP